MTGFTARKFLFILVILLLFLFACNNFDEGVLAEVMGETSPDVELEPGPEYESETVQETSPRPEPAPPVR